jgi:hypothetical protein
VPPGGDLTVVPPGGDLTVVPPGAEAAGTLVPPGSPGSGALHGAVPGPDVRDFVGAVAQTDFHATGTHTAASGLTVFSDPTIPVASSSVADVTGDPLQDLARAMIDAAEDALAALARLWADPPSPGIGTSGPDGAVEPSQAVGLLQNSLSWYTAAIAVVAVLITAGRMAWQRRSEPATDLLRGLLTLVLVTGAAVTAITLVVGAADAFSVWVLEQATDDVEASFVDLVALPDAGGMPVVLTILLGSVVMLGAVLQIVFILARGAVLVVLTGLLPLAASATSTVTGRAVFVRTLTWIAAFVLYQPVAAMIYATSFLVVPDPEQSPVVAALTGTTFLGLALAALPALLRVLRPVMTAATSVERGAHAAGRLPSGALAVGPATLAVGAQVLRDSGSTYAVGTPGRRAGGAALHAAPRTIASHRVAVDGAGAVRSGVPARRVLEIQGEVSPGTLVDGPADDARPVPHPRPGGEDVS